LWDLLPDGRQLGGAPANFVIHAHALGADARLVSRVGNDPLGGEVLERFRLLGLPTDTLVMDGVAPTGTVSVKLAPGGQPEFTIAKDVA
jgi:fructokinase